MPKKPKKEDPAKNAPQGDNPADKATRKALRKADPAFKRPKKQVDIDSDRDDRVTQ